MPVLASLPPDPSIPLDRENRRRAFLWGSAVCVIVLAMRTPILVRPGIIIDDFQILAQSWTWEATRANLWLPANEHSMPLGRLSTWAAVRVTGRLTDTLRLLCFQGPLAVAVAAVLVYLFVRRETGQPLPALLAMALFGVSTHYWEAVVWFAASFAVLGLVMLLLGLVAAQRWRQTGRRRSLVWSALWCGLAPGWFGTGMLAGPLCSLYLLGSDTPALRQDQRWRRRLLALTPCLGTAISLAVTLPLNAERILNLPRSSLNKKAWETFNPLVGLEYTLRAVVDDVLPGVVGVSTLSLPVPWVWLALVVLVGAGVWWWRSAPARALILLGLGMIVSNYLLIFTARAYQDYADVHSSRYQLYPHLGLALIVGGGWRRGWYPTSLGAIPHWKVAAFLAVLVLAQSWPNWCWIGDLRQAADFRRIEEVDARCRRYHIDARTARQALPEKFEVVGCTPEQKVDGRPVIGWDFLRGSDDPRPVSIDEARRLLVPTDEP